MRLTADAGDPERQTGPVQAVCPPTSRPVSTRLTVVGFGAFFGGAGFGAGACRCAFLARAAAAFFVAAFRAFRAFACAFFARPFLCFFLSAFFWASFFLAAFFWAALSACKWTTPSAAPCATGGEGITKVPVR